MLRTILVDDERPALNALNHLLKEYPDIEITGAFTRIDQAMELIRNDGSIDLLFLDIDMPKINGIAAAREIQEFQSKIAIVFVTAYQHFAVEAFEVNAVDYIMKPVSKKRLDKTMDRVAQIILAGDEPVPQQERDIFLRDFITGKITNQGECLQKAKSLGIDFTQDFSLFFILIAGSKNQPLWKNPHDMSPVMAKLTAKLASETGLIPWQTVHGIGVIDFNIPASDDCKARELAKAIRLKSSIESDFPGITAYLGIADRNSGSRNLTGRFFQARNAAVIGMHIYPDSGFSKSVTPGAETPEPGVYPFLDSGFLPVLDQYVDERKVDDLIDNTIVKILEYDRKNNADLFRTMEKMIICNNLQEVAEALFIHYKTVTFRKQSIEKILGMAMNSFTGRTMLGVALTLYYLRSIPPLTDDASET
jgi:DNA-binding NarL/FixJ family response regulator